MSNVLTSSVQSQCPRCGDIVASSAPACPTCGVQRQRPVASTPGVVTPGRTGVPAAEPPNGVILRATVTNAHLELLPDRIRIVGEAGPKQPHGNVEIMLMSITHVNYRPASSLRKGHIQFEFGSGQGLRTGGKHKLGFTVAQQPNVERLKEAVEKQKSVAISTMLAPRRNGAGDQT